MEGKPSLKGSVVNLFTITVNKIAVQPDKYKPISLKPIELEVLRLKRALVDLTVSVQQKESRFSAILEYRGRALTLSRSTGDADADKVGNCLGTEFSKRYGKEGLRLLASPNPGRVCECTISDPSAFLGFLHVVKNRGGVDVYEGIPDIDAIMSGTPEGRRGTLGGVLDRISEMSRGTGTVVEVDLVASLVKDGFSEEDVRSVVYSLMRDGTIYSPKLGKLRPATGF